MNWKNKIDPILGKIAAYVIGVVTVLYLLYKISGPVFSFIGWFIGLLGDILRLLTPLFWGFFVAYLLMPLANFLQKKISGSRFNRKQKSCRGLAVALTIMIVLACLVLLLSVLISTFTSQIQIADFNSTMAFLKGLGNNINGLYQQIVKYLTSLDVDAQQIQDGVDTIVNAFRSWITDMGKNMVATIEDIPHIVSQAIFIIIFAIWFLLDGARIAMYWGRVMAAIFPDKAREKIREFLEDCDEAFSGYIRGQVVDALLMMLAISMVLYICDVPFAIAIGVLAGIGNLIPYVGPFIAYAGTIIVCLVNGEFTKMIFVLIILWVIQSIDGNIINPKLLGKHVHLHPMYVIVALIIGGSWGGLLGMLFAVPIAALIKKVFDRFIKRRLARLKEKKERQEAEIETEIKDDQS
jgi:predicted PurR-regulated permease PerM